MYFDSVFASFEAIFGLFRDCCIMRRIPEVSLLLVDKAHI